MRVPQFVWRLALLGVAILLGVSIYNDPVMDGLRGIKPTAIDWCARANLRACNVKDQGQWILVSTPDGAQHMIYVENGKVVQVQ